MNEKITKELINMAVHTALNSNDFPKIGAIIVHEGAYSEDNRNFISGNNILLLDSEDPNCDTRLVNVIHAEINALSKAANIGFITNGATIYVSGKCVCLPCAKAIADAGITKVVCPPADSNSKWTLNNKAALELLREEGINIIISEELIGLDLGLTLSEKYE